MKRQPYVRLSASMVVNNLHGLTWEEMGAYVRLLSIMAHEGQPIPDDEHLTRQMNGTASDWHRVKSCLLNKGKIAISRGGLVNSGSGVS